MITGGGGEDFKARGDIVKGFSLEFFLNWNR